MSNCRKAEHLKLNEAKWDRWAGTLDKKSRRNDFLRGGQRAVVDLLDLKQGTTFLDIGCGTGWAVNLAAESVRYEGLFYGIDLSAKMVLKAEENFKGRENFHFVRADSRSIPLDDDFFDAIICTHSFHHYLEPQKVVNEMYRLLKGGGKLYILDPTTDHWCARLLDQFFKLTERDHVKMYNTDEFREMFTTAGLKYIGTEVVKSIDKIHIAEK